MRRLSCQKGFTLLEVMIAFALLTVILFVAVIAQTSSLASSGRSKNLLMATSLARNFLNKEEVQIEGAPFDQLEKKQEGSFPEPNQDYKWTLEISQVDFSVLASLAMKQMEASGQSQQANTDTLLKLFEDYLNRSVRRMTLTVHYPDAGKTSDLTFTELLVNYDQDFATGM